MNTSILFCYFKIIHKKIQKFNMGTGTTYCNLSHLPIKEDDKCIAIPLGFNISFRRPQEISSYSFMSPWVFIWEAIEVTYKGHPFEVEWPPSRSGGVNTWKGNETQMLIHRRFWNELQKWYDNNFPSFCELANSIAPYPEVERIYILVREIVAMEELRLAYRCVKDKSDETIESILDSVAKIKTPREYLEILRLWHFMERVGIAIAPNRCIDQSGEWGGIYSRMKKRANKNTDSANTDGRHTAF